MKSIHNVNIEENVKKEFNRRSDIYNYGDDNNYPSIIKKLIDSSVTAKACTELMSSFLYGKGFENNTFYLNSSNVTPNAFLRQITVDAPYYKGFAIHVSYNALGEKSSFKLIPFNWVRWGREDVNGYKSKVKVCKDWNDTRKNPIDEYDVYKPSVAIQQIENSGGLSNYKGQILYVSLDFQNLYPKPFADSVINDIISEGQSSLLKRNLLTKGFINNTIVTTKPFEDPKDRDHFRKGLKSQLGSEGAGSIVHMEASLESDNLQDEILTTPISSDIDDKLFEYTDKNTSDKIRKAFLNIPPALIDANDTSIFGQSGETLKQMKLFYQEQTEHLRDHINEVINELFTGTVNDKLNNEEFIIRKLVKDDVIN